jgi:hypothetical protein
MFRIFKKRMAGKLEVGRKQTPVPPLKMPQRQFLFGGVTFKSEVAGMCSDDIAATLMAQSKITGITIGLELECALAPPSPLMVKVYYTPSEADFSMVNNQWLEADRIQCLQTFATGYLGLEPKLPFFQSLSILSGSWGTGGKEHSFTSNKNN